MAFEAGQSGLVVPVAAAEPVVSDLRARFDPAAVLGVPAHITVVYPFLPAERVTPAVAAELAALVAAVPAPRVTFADVGRFPGVLYLAPSPAEPFVALTRVVAARWPEAPPYGGAYGDNPVPHLTVTQTASGAEQDEAARVLAARLPVTADLTDVALVVFDGARWTVRRRFPFR